MLDAGGRLRHVLTPEQFESIYGPIWAPDSKRLAVVRLTAGGSRLAILDLDGNATYVSGDDQPDRWVAWTPDGQHIIYSTIDNRANGVFNRVRIVPASGGTAITVWEGRSGTFGVTGVAGLADGRIMFLSDDGLMTVNRDGTDLHPLTPVGLRPGDAGAPQQPTSSPRYLLVSPNGRRVATVAGGEYAILDIASGAKLASTAARQPQPVEWSPDSRRVAFFDGTVLSDDGSVTRLGNADAAFTTARPDVVAITSSAEEDGSIAELIAPDGSRRLLAHRAFNTAGGGPHVAVTVYPPRVDLLAGKGGAVICLVGQPRALAAFPESMPEGLGPQGIWWSPDGQHLAVISRKLQP